MKIRKDFDIREFVPKAVWQNFGESSTWFVDERILDLAQFYRDYFDAAVTVNTWHYGGKFEERGFRVPRTQTGASLSQHKFGRAFDCTIEGLSPDEVREEIMASEDIFMEKGLTTLESGDIATTWVHNDIRNHGDDEILIVRP